MSQRGIKCICVLTFTHHFNYSTHNNRTHTHTQTLSYRCISLLQCSCIHKKTHTHIFKKMTETVYKPYCMCAMEKLLLVYCTWFRTFCLILSSQMCMITPHISTENNPFLNTFLKTFCQSTKFLSKTYCGANLIPLPWKRELSASSSRYWCMLIVSCMHGRCMWTIQQPSTGSLSSFPIYVYSFCVPFMSFILSR